MKNRSFKFSPDCSGILFVEFEAEQKDIAESGTKVSPKVKCSASIKLSKSGSVSIV